MTLDDWLATPLIWQPTSEGERAVSGFDYRAAGPNGERLGITIGDFPDEDLYALVVDNMPVGSFSDFPANWTTSAHSGTAQQKPGGGKCPHCGK